MTTSFFILGRNGDKKYRFSPKQTHTLDNIRCRSIQRKLLTTDNISILRVFIFHTVLYFIIALVQRKI